jgi:photosystem II stability/assembly factor-like uncharacterized protein
MASVVVTGGLWTATLAVNAAVIPPLPSPHISPSAPADTPLPGNPLISSWPDQAVRPVRPCSSPSLASGAVQLLSVRRRIPSESPDLIDPWAPCRVYVSSHTGNYVLRSDNAGQSFETVLQGGSPASLLLSGVSAPAPGAVAVFDTEGMRAILKSTDDASTWRQYGTDLPITGSSASNCIVCLQALVFAPSDPNIGYAVLNAYSSAIFRTSDGGQTWTARGTPGPLMTMFGHGMARQQPIIIDPRDSNHAYAVVDLSTAVAIVETRDGGQSWQQVNTPRHDAPDHVMVTATGAVYLAYGAADTAASLLSTGPQLLARFSDGGQWSSLPVPAGTVSAWSIGFDPQNGSQGVFAGVKADPNHGPQLVLADSHDGFVTVDDVRTVALPNSLPSKCGQCFVDLMPDAFGDFYVDAEAGVPGTPDPVGEALLALRLPLIAVHGAAANSPPGPAPTGNPGCRPAPSPMTASPFCTRIPGTTHLKRTRP